jgi:hypothetical protein
MATVIQGKQQLSGTFAEMWLVTETVDFGAAATGSGTFASVDVTVPNVALGDMLVAVSMGVDTVDGVVSGAVTAAGVVTLTLLNNSAGAIDLASTTCKFIIGRPSW